MASLGFSLHAWCSARGLWREDGPSGRECSPCWLSAKDICDACLAVSKDDLLPKGRSQPIRKLLDQIDDGFLVLGLHCGLWAAIRIAPVIARIAYITDQSAITASHRTFAIAMEDASKTAFASPLGPPRSIGQRGRYHFFDVPGASKNVAAAGVIPYLVQPGGDIQALFQIEDEKDNTHPDGWRSMLAMLGGKASPQDQHWTHTAAREAVEEVSWITEV